MKNTRLLNLLLFVIVLPFFVSCDNDNKKEASEKIYTNKKIFIIGDSTVHNTTWKDGEQIGFGWGDQLLYYMKNQDDLINLAEPGASSRSYKERSDLEYDGWFHNWYQTKEIIQDTDISDGGYLFIQFGHNDEAEDGTLSGIGNSFYDELKEYVDYAKDVGLTPVLITPVERMYKVQGFDLEYSHIKDVGDYAQTIRDLSYDEDVLLLDLQKRSWNDFNRYIDTKELVKDFGYRDYTHFSEDGAWVVAGWVKELICSSEDKDLCRQFR